MGDLKHKDWGGQCALNPQEGRKSNGTAQNPRGRSSSPPSLRKLTPPPQLLSTTKSLFFSVLCRKS